MIKYAVLGSRLGYPKCCIIEFILVLKTRTLHLRPTRKLCGTGYIPCHKCNEEFTEEVLINNINKDRSQELPPFTSRS